MDPDLELDAGKSTPIPAGADVAARDRPLTRRELRARERAAEAARGGEASVPAAASAAPGCATAPLPKSACTAQPLRMPPLVTRTVEPAPTRRRSRAWVGKGASLVAMLFVVGMAVATSVPANAFVSADAVDGSQRTVARAPGQAGDAQRITSGGDVAGQAVVRDVYQVKSVEQVAAANHIRMADTFTNDSNGTIQWPFPVGVPIASYFGPRIAPTAGASSFHEGVDFDPGRGAPIHSIADGVVREVAPYNDNALGVHVIVDHTINGRLVSSVYGHMTPGSIRVTQGQSVKVGDVLGLVGSTGVSTGPHLHFEIRLDGTTPVDPYAWLKQNAN